MKPKLLILFLAFIAFVNSEIIEVERFGDMNRYLTPDALLIVDIDDTLLIPVQMLGCDLWFLSRLKESGSLERTLGEWEAIRHITKMKVVEEGTEEIIQNWQNQGFKLMGLTSQGLALATRTVLQLQANGIDLSSGAPFPGGAYYSIQGHGILYRHGILFCSGKSKGDSLAHLFEQHGFWPSKIIFIDDKESPLIEVETFALDKGIAFTGLRYAFADRHKALYRPEIAAIQFAHSTFVHLLSDEEAAALLR